MSNIGNAYVSDNSYYTQQYYGSVLGQYSQSNATQSQLPKVSTQTNPVYQTPNTGTYITAKPHYYDNNAITNKRQKLDEELSSIDAFLNTSRQQLTQQMAATYGQPVSDVTLRVSTFGQPSESVAKVQPQRPTAPQPRPSFSGQNPYYGKNIDFFEPLGIAYPPQARPTMMPTYRPLYYGESANRFRDSYRTKEVIDYTKDVSLNTKFNLPNRAPLLPPPIIQSTAAANSFQSQANKRNDFSRPTPNIRPAPQSTANFTNASARNDSVGHQASNRPPLPNQTSSTPKASDQFRDKICYPFQNDGIIITYNRYMKQNYYCGYCDAYIKRYPTVTNHVTIDAHKESKEYSVVDCITRGFNKKFILNFLEVLNFNDEQKRKLSAELNRVPLHLKHFYKNKGIRIDKGFPPHAYFCIWCRTHLPSVIAIEGHLQTEDHIVKEHTKKLGALIRLTPEKPIIGLQHIIEYNDNPTSKQEVVYECTLCQFTTDTVDMYSHIYTFEHRVQLLRECFPNDSRKFCENTPRMHQLVENEIRNLQKMFKLGKVKKKFGVAAPPMSNFETLTVNEPNDERERRSPSVEVIRVVSPSERQSKYAFNLITYEQAADAAIVIQSLKEAIIKYYLQKIPDHMRNELIRKISDQ